MTGQRTYQHKAVAQGKATGKWVKCGCRCCNSGWSFPLTLSRISRISRIAVYVSG